MPGKNGRVHLWSDSMTLPELQQSLHNCQRCKLAKLGRSQVVFGTGNPKAEIMFVGEAPGFYEDKQGEPFVGAAGKLFNELLQSIGVTRSQVYIANVIKCRPPENRDPEMDEVETCKPFLLQQIELIQPKLVCTLGRWAAETILGRKISIMKVRGQAYRQDRFVVFPLLHPAAALHQGNLRGPLEEDFAKLKAYLDQANHPLPKPPSSGATVPAEAAATPPAQMDLFGA
jgi:uracil-DNA glycosylase family 4